MVPYRPFGSLHKKYKGAKRFGLKKLFIVSLLALALSLSGLSGRFPQRTASATQTSAAAVQQPLEQMAPMRDGVKLSTLIFLPAGAGPWPVVLIRTPYGKNSQTRLHAEWTTRRFALVVQDCRGTFQSEGKYRPFVDDGVDGYDTIEWIAKQSWSNGRIGMYGASAMGIAANEAAMTNPPHLIAAFVMVARSNTYEQSSFIGGVFRKELNEDWLKRQKAESVLNEIFKHEVHSDFYDRSDMSKHWSQVHIPIYNYGGWYDIFNQGNIDNFVGLQTKAATPGTGKQKLIMGPWGHGQLEEVKYPENAGNGAFGGSIPTELAFRWFEYWLKQVDNGIMKEPPVRYYVMGDVNDPKAPGNEWHTSAVWPVPAQVTSYFLGDNGTLSESSSRKNESADSYKYDPNNPVPTVGGANLFLKKGPMDQRAIGERSDVLKFSTAELKAPVEITGRIAVELWAESDAPDTDFMAKLIDVYPDGTERLVLDSALRARFREGFDHEVFMRKGQVYKFKIDLWSTSLIFNAGHRIAIHVSSSNNPRFDPNPNTGKPLRADKLTQVATNSIHHDRLHPSRALLPVVRPNNGSISYRQQKPGSIQ
jgi:predicted acyl esterase